MENGPHIRACSVAQSFVWTLCRCNRSLRIRHAIAYLPSTTRMAYAKVGEDNKSNRRAFGERIAVVEFNPLPYRTSHYSNCLQRGCLICLCASPAFPFSVHKAQLCPLVNPVCPFAAVVNTNNSTSPSDLSVQRWRTQIRRTVRPPLELVSCRLALATCLCSGTVGEASCIQWWKGLGRPEGATTAYTHRAKNSLTLPHLHTLVHLHRHNAKTQIVHTHVRTCTEAEALPSTHPPIHVTAVMVPVAELPKGAA